ncbi:hypothetical protein Cni_G06313 [Canna indica]|uniref:Uncharacterized protein n=1 Tax=Canna indica TaxID=4628 RepID=A0AAQ3Q3X7_9LILI|nr:hypothetical protein Cni_G06313 [Canna indica]
MGMGATWRRLGPPVSVEIQSDGLAEQQMICVRNGAGLDAAKTRLGESVAEQNLTMPWAWRSDAHATKGTGRRCGACTMRAARASFGPHQAWPGLCPAHWPHDHTLGDELYHLGDPDMVRWVLYEAQPDSTRMSGLTIVWQFQSNKLPPFGWLAEISPDHVLGQDACSGRPNPNKMKGSATEARLLDVLRDLWSLVTWCSCVHYCERQMSGLLATPLLAAGFLSRISSPLVAAARTRDSPFLFNICSGTRSSRFANNGRSS